MVMAVSLTVCTAPVCVRACSVCASGDAIDPSAVGLAAKTSDCAIAGREDDCCPLCRLPLM